MAAPHASARYPVLGSTRALSTCTEQIRLPDVSPLTSPASKAGEGRLIESFPLATSETLEILDVWSCWVAAGQKWREVGILVEDKLMEHVCPTNNS